jgi:hypothetical protein
MGLGSCLSSVGLGLSSGVLLGKLGLCRLCTLLAQRFSLLLLLGSGGWDRLEELVFRFMGGTNGPVYFCWVMNGWSFACCGDHRSKGLIFNKPRIKSMNATLLFISVYFVSELS